jgi:hypothetical protein
MGEGVEQVGSIGCLVQREGTFYALTNKHVAGAEGEIVRAVIGASSHTIIGKADGAAVTKQTLREIFPGFPGDRTYVNLDAGLVRVTDASNWTAQVFGIGEIGELYDATENSITLDLIGCPVRAFGAASGTLEGEIRALFFRYQSSGNYDYVSDVLIGPRGPVHDARGVYVPSMRPHPQTHPGDSGTIWFYDPARNETERGVRARRMRPIAMQWGGARIRTGHDTSAYALGTFLSTICRVLDVEIVRDFSIGWDEYWGKIGHFAVGWKACESKLLTDSKLAALMSANQERVGFDDKTLGQGSAFRMGRDGFVPLADVPDYVWVPAARYSKPRAHEPEQHFADVDLPPVGDKVDFLAQCAADKSLVSPDKWNAFFSAFAEKGAGPEEGALPFRVWQIWDAMVEFLKDDKLDHFVAAAGTLAHYIGDASQPLHCSYLHHGRLPMMNVEGDKREYPVAHSSKEFQAYAKTPPAKVHGIYEEGMLEIDPASALASVDEVLDGKPQRTAAINSGQDAAYETVLLMDRARKRLTPDAIIDADDPTKGPKTRARQLWANEKIQKATVESLADSVQVLARVWQSAWDAAGGSKSAATAFSEDVLMQIYRSNDFLVPMTLSEWSSSAPSKAKKTTAKKTTTTKTAKKKTKRSK